MRKVLLADRMQEVLDDLVFALGDHFLVKTCTDGQQLRALADSFKPDILVLDLSMPGYEPMAFLSSLPKPRPLIVATTIYTNDHLVHLLEQQQAKALLTKPLHADSVASLLLKYEQLLDPEPELRGAVYEAMLCVGVKLRYSGFTQLSEGILFACGKEQYSLTDEVYPHVARVCYSTEQAVEKAMSRCISQSYDRADRRLWYCLFGQRQCPSNGVFIHRLSLGIKKKQRKP